MVPLAIALDPSRLHIQHQNSVKCPVNAHPLDPQLPPPPVLKKHQKVELPYTRSIKSHNGCQSHHIGGYTSTQRGSV